MTAQKKALAPIEDLRQNLTRMSDEFKKALPAHIEPDKFIRVVMTAIQNTPSILECDRRTLYGACMRAATDGLLPDGREGAIVAYGKTATWVPMVGGLCKKARNSGEIASIDAQVVYQNDIYEHWTDEKGPHFNHVKERGERGGPVLTYAYAITKDGGFFFEEITEEQMADIEAVSRAKTGPWKGPFKDEMRRKSAIRRLAKYRLPSSTDLEDVIRRDDEAFDSEAAPSADSSPTSSRLSKLISGTSEAPEEALPDYSAEFDTAYDVAKEVK